MRRLYTLEPIGNSEEDQMSYGSDGTQYSRGVGAIAATDLRTRPVSRLAGAARQIGLRPARTRVSIVAGRTFKRPIIGQTAPIPTPPPSGGSRVGSELMPTTPKAPPIMTAPAPPPAASAPVFGGALQIGTGIGQPSRGPSLAPVITAIPEQRKFPVGMIAVGGGVALAAYLFLRRK